MKTNTFVATKRSDGCKPRSRNSSDHGRSIGREGAISCDLAGHPYVCRKRNAVPTRGTKINELNRWYNVNGTWPFSMRSHVTPSGRVMKYHSPEAVHSSYAIVSATLISAKRATDFTRNTLRGSSRRR